MRTSKQTAIAIHNIACELSVQKSGVNNAVFLRVLTGSSYDIGVLFGAEGDRISVIDRRVFIAVTLGLLGAQLSVANTFAFTAVVKGTFAGGATLDPRRPWREGTFQGLEDGTKLFATREVHGAQAPIRYILHEESAISFLVTHNGVGMTGPPQVVNRRNIWSPILVATGCPFDPEAELVSMVKDKQQRVVNTVSKRQGRRGMTRVEVKIKSYHPYPNDRFPKEYEIVESRVSREWPSAKTVLNVKTSNVRSVGTTPVPTIGQSFRPGTWNVPSIQLVGNGRFEDDGTKLSADYSPMKMIFPLLAIGLLTSGVLGAAFALKSFKRVPALR